MSAEARASRSGYWDRLVRCYWQGPTDEAVAAVVEALVDAEERGETSSIWHETHAYAIAHTDWPACSYCGGPADPRLGLHNLCAELAKRDLPTPRLDSRPACECVPCRRARGLLPVTL